MAAALAFFSATRFERTALKGKGEVSAYTRVPGTYSYSAFCSFWRSNRRRLRARRWRRRCRRIGVTSRWILGLANQGELTTSMGEYRNSRLGGGLGVLLLRALDLPSDDVLSHIVLLAQVEELSDLGRTLGTESLGEDVVCQSGDLALALLDDDEGEDGDVGTDDAPTDGLALALTVATGTVARVTIGEEEADTLGKQDTLFHGEPLLVVPTGDADDVALEFIAYRVGLDFLGDFLVEKDAAGWG